MTWLIAALIVIVILAVVVAFSGAVVYIPNDRVGVVERLWGGPSLKTGLIAQNGEVGFQPQLLRGGLHYFTPFQWRVHRQELVTIPQGQIGYLFARDGENLGSGQALGRSVKSGVEDAEAFLKEGGQKGPQRIMLREGTYAINLALFAVITASKVYGLLLSSDESKTIESMGTTLTQRNGFIPVIIGTSKAGENGMDNDLLGIVTTHDGPVLERDTILAPVVGTDPSNAETFHNSFQNIEAFLAAGGRRGRQYAVILEGTYYLNRLFATVEFAKKTIIPVGYVGVVISYVGEAGEDTSGDAYTHGELVPKGCRGVWKDPLMPGKYAFNVYGGNITLVPTQNFTLKWQKDVVSGHKYDDNLTEVGLITSDAFEPLMPLSVVLHIEPSKAPRVIQRFGDIRRLVEQTLDPMISAYFKNEGQTRTLIELIKKRSDIQEKAGADMKQRFSAYDLEFQEVLIGTPHGDRGTPSGERIDTILNQLRDREVAKEQTETYQEQQKAATAQRALRNAQAETDIQEDLTKSKVNVEISTNKGDADVAAAEKAARVVAIQAEATRKRMEAEGVGKAAAIKAVGVAEAEAIRAKAEALTGEGARYQILSTLGGQLADAIAKAPNSVVPHVIVGGDGSDSNPVGMLTSLLSGMLGMRADQAGSPATKPPSESVAG